MTVLKRILLSIVVFSSLMNVGYAFQYINSIAGTGSTGSPSVQNDFGPATSAFLNKPVAFWADTLGNQYIIETEGHRVRKVDLFGIITTIIGTGTASSNVNNANGDTLSASAASMKAPFQMIRDIFSVSVFYIAEMTNNRIRKIGADGNAYTICGNSGPASIVADDVGGPTAVTLNGPKGLWMDGTGIIYFTESGGRRLRRLSADGNILTVVAGSGSSVQASTSAAMNNAIGDGGPATSALLHTPEQIYMYPGNDNKVLIADRTIARIRLYIPSSGNMTTIAGTSLSPAWSTADPVPATSCAIGFLTGIYGDSQNTIYLAGFNDYRVRKMDSNYIITIISGTGTVSGSTMNVGDGGPITQATFNQPYYCFVDSVGNLYVADAQNHRIRYLYDPVPTAAPSLSLMPSASPTIAPTLLYTNTLSQITTVAGSGEEGFQDSPAEIAATAAEMRLPFSIWCDSEGTMYINDKLNYRIRKVDKTTNLMSNYAGIASGGGYANGYPATSFAFNDPKQIHGFIATNSLYFADGNYNQVFCIDMTTKIVHVVIGSGDVTHAGDGGKATSATMTYPVCVMTDSSGNIYTCADNRIRRVDFTTSIITTIAGNGGPTPNLGDGGSATSASFTNIMQLCVQGKDLYMALQDSNSAIRSVDLNTKIIKLTVGTYAEDFVNIPGAATSTKLSKPSGVYKDRYGMIFISERTGHSIKKVDREGQLVTIAGTGGPSSGDIGDGGLVYQASFDQPQMIFADTLGFLYIADSYNRRVRKIYDFLPTAQPTVVPTAGPTEFQVEFDRITTVIGTGVAGSAGVGGDATAAQLDADLDFGPQCVWGDVLSYIYIADTAGQKIKTINPGSNIVTVLAGTGSTGNTGDSGAATSATFNYPFQICGDTSRIMYVSDFLNHVVRKIDLGNGILTLFAGNYQDGESGNGGPATSATLGYNRGVWKDSAGGVYITSSLTHQIRKVAPDGIISHWGGNQSGDENDGGPVSSAAFMNPMFLWGDTTNRLYIVDQDHQKVRVVSLSTRIINTVSGNGETDSFGTGGVATSMPMLYPFAVWGDTNGNVYVTENIAGRVKQITPNGILVPIAGTGMFSTTPTDANGDGGTDLLAATFNRPSGLFLSTTFELYIVDSDNYKVRKLYDGNLPTVSPTVRPSMPTSQPSRQPTVQPSRFYGELVDVSLVAGTGSPGTSGDNGPATSANIGNPNGLWMNPNGIMFIGAKTAHTLRRVDNVGIITTVAGTGIVSANGASAINDIGDDGAATSVTFYELYQIFGFQNHLYMADSGNHKVRLLTISSSIVTVFAGNGVYASNGDIGKATSASLSYPYGVWRSTTGYIYIAEVAAHKIRVVDTNNIITKVAGTGSLGYTGDGGPATSATLNRPNQLFGDTVGNLFVAEQDNRVVRRIKFSTGFINTFAGTGTRADVDVTGVATSTSLYDTNGVWGDVKGVIYATTGNNRLKRILDGIMSTFSYHASTPPLNVGYSNPTGLFIDSIGSLYVADCNNNKVRKLYAYAPTVAPTLTPTMTPSWSLSPHIPPTSQPSNQPSQQPTRQPSGQPSRQPSTQPSAQPVMLPSSQPSIQPTNQPTRQPSTQPTSQPLMRPSTQPSSQPSRVPTRQPSGQPSGQPTGQPSMQPSSQPSRRPSMQPTSSPSCQPSRQPTGQPSSQPSTQPSQQPHSRPSGKPSCQPSVQPSRTPTRQPSSQPSSQPSRQPSQQPTSQPSVQPSMQPIMRPSCQPSRQPSSQPTGIPSKQPTVSPSRQPTGQPSYQPSLQPICRPSAQPSSQPSIQPTLQPTRQPTQSPSRQPTSQPSNQPSRQPSTQPTLQPLTKPSCQPSTQPSANPTVTPLVHPTSQPSNNPSIQPSCQPSTQPSEQPTRQPSRQPSSQPSAQPVMRPSCRPSRQPTCHPSAQPSVQPSCQPSGQPSVQPSRSPSGQPSITPSVQPSSQPMGQPSCQPTSQPSVQPSIRPLAQPTCQPTFQPSVQPVSRPSTQPSIQPSTIPSRQPSEQPSGQPSIQPSIQPLAQPSCQPSVQPSTQPVSSPSTQPSIQPSAQPLRQPTNQPSCQPTLQPTCQPSVYPSCQPTGQPSLQPVSRPSSQPSVQPSFQPTSQPLGQPSTRPSLQPTSQPSSQPFTLPSGQPSSQPSQQPSRQPSSQPSVQPTIQPTSKPFGRPSTQPSAQPSCQPVTRPSSQPSRQPSVQPSRLPSSQPTKQPSRQPTIQPSSKPSTQPSSRPSIQPSVQPSLQPTLQPSQQPTLQPSRQPSCQPSATPTARPLSAPTVQPSKQPSSQPTTHPTTQPTAQPIGQPSTQPSAQPTSQPFSQPTGCPSRQPSSQPSRQPSSQPSTQPSVQPVSRPSCQPSAIPSRQPSGQPSTYPSRQPTSQPSSHPSRQPSCQPTRQPSIQPSVSPSVQPSQQPTRRPSVQPSSSPSLQPSCQPSCQPFAQPSNQPTSQPTCIPIVRPTSQPSSQPSSMPSAQPSRQPTSQPSVVPSGNPSTIPSNQPFACPTTLPSQQPSSIPSCIPSMQPSEQPTEQPSLQPSSVPSSHPSCQPVGHPSVQPSAQPTCIPSTQPSLQPSSVPTSQPSNHPSMQPSVKPSSYPSSQPTYDPSTFPSVQPSSQPSSQPFGTPSAVPSTRPSMQPSEQPIMQPSSHPSSEPSQQPASQPSDQPFASPSSQPTCQPTVLPSTQPSDVPTCQPTTNPTEQPSTSPTTQPTQQPSQHPSALPSSQPSSYPSRQPSAVPTKTPSRQPTTKPSSMPSGTSTRRPTTHPSGQPSHRPSVQPTAVPSFVPSSQPSSQPSCWPTVPPTIQPSSQPIARPSLQPSRQPTVQPSTQPSRQPSAQPIRRPTNQPTGQPTRQPSRQPTGQPSRQPSSKPTFKGFVLTSFPTTRYKPTELPTMIPTNVPTDTPTFMPTLPTDILPRGRGVWVNFGTGQNESHFRIVLPFLFTNGIFSDGFENITIGDRNTSIAYIRYGRYTSESQIVQATSLSFMTPAISYDYTARSVSIAGDVNGDGFDDLIIGVPYANLCYLLYGNANGFVNMTTGFTIFGVDSSDLTGWSVSGAGDVNNDTYADIIVGAPNARNANGVFSGVAYVIFGSTNASIVWLDRPWKFEVGFGIYGIETQDGFGLSVSGAGDTNGDGIDDVVVSALRMNDLFSGSIAIVYGRGKSPSQHVSLASLTSTRGVIVYGPSWSWFGYSVSGVGDVNGDGYDDVAVGSIPRRTVASPPITYILLGSKTLVSVADVTKLPLSKSIVVSGGGTVVSNVGDLNGDGLFDVMIGALYDLNKGVGYVIHEPTDIQQASVSPTLTPTSVSPTLFPSLLPSVKPSRAPSWKPTVRPTAPTIVPTIAPTGPTELPTMIPTQPTSIPTAQPSAPSLAPTLLPTIEPSALPTVVPSDAPSVIPTCVPSAAPSFEITFIPTTEEPSHIPTRTPTLWPSRFPVTRPTAFPASPRPTNNETLYTPVVIPDSTVDTSYSRGMNYINYIVNNSAAITFTGTGRNDIFTVIPKRDALLVINYLNLTSDLIDLQHFYTIRAVVDLNWTLSYATFTTRRHLRSLSGVEKKTMIIFFAMGQRIIITNFNGTGIDDIPLRFYDGPLDFDSLIPKGSQGISRQTMMIAVGVICGGIFAVLFFKIFSWWYKRHTYLMEKRNPMKWEDQRRNNPTFTTFIHQDSTMTAFTDYSEHSSLCSSLSSEYKSGDDSDDCGKVIPINKFGVKVGPNRQSPSETGSDNSSISSEHTGSDSDMPDVNQRNQHAIREESKSESPCDMTISSFNTEDMAISSQTLSEVAALNCEPPSRLLKECCVFISQEFPPIPAEVGGGYFNSVEQTKYNSYAGSSVDNSSDGVNCTISDLDSVEVSTAVTTAVNSTEASPSKTFAVAMTAVTAAHRLSMLHRLTTSGMTASKADESPSAVTASQQQTPGDLFDTLFSQHETVNEPDLQSEDEVSDSAAGDNMYDDISMMSDFTVPDEW